MKLKLLYCSLLLCLGTLATPKKCITHCPSAAYKAAGNPATACPEKPAGTTAEAPSATSTGTTAATTATTAEATAAKAPIAAPAELEAADASSLSLIKLFYI